MSFQPLIQILENLLLLHKSLNNLAEEKIKILKRGDTDALSNLLKTEKKHIQAIEKQEKERQKVSAECLRKCGIKAIENPTISDCIAVANSTEKQKLEMLKTDLYSEVEKLSHTNQLNQQLLQQSMQFINLSLDLLLPDIEAYNYERPGLSQQSREAHSIFNTKA